MEEAEEVGEQGGGVLSSIHQVGELRVGITIPSQALGKPDNFAELEKINIWQSLTLLLTIYFDQLLLVQQSTTKNYGT